MEQQSKRGSPQEESWKGVQACRLKAGNRQDLKIKTGEHLNKEKIGQKVEQERSVELFGFSIRK